MNVEAVLRRFQEETRVRLKPGVQRQYGMVFRRFARMSELDRLTRRGLASKGKILILDHLQHVPRRSWRYEIAMLKSVWMLGLNLPWPIDMKRDIGRLPRTRPAETPSDETVKAWGEAMQKESDPYLRLLWLLIAQTGWRPGHVAALNAADVKRDSIERHPDNREFKTESPIAARKWPDLTDALHEWMSVRAPNSEALLPWRSSRSGVVDPRKRLNDDTLRRLWHSIRKKWNLPYLTPKGMRHWVATACRKAGLSRVASAWLMGHDASDGEAMRDWYDNPRLDDILDEQASALPNGPLGILRLPEVRVDGGLPKEIVSLVQIYLAGRILTREFADEMEAIRLRSLARNPGLTP